MKHKSYLALTLIFALCASLALLSGATSGLYAGNGLRGHIVALWRFVGC